MFNRRSFFRHVAAVVAAVALAPEIAFNAKLPLPEPELMPYQLNLTDLFDACYDLLRRRRAADCGHEFFQSCSGEWQPTVTSPSTQQGFFEQLKSCDRMLA